MSAVGQCVSAPLGLAMTKLQWFAATEMPRDQVGRRTPFRVAACPDGVLAVPLLVCRQPRDAAGLTDRWPLAVATLICYGAMI